MTLQSLGIDNSNSLSNCPSLPESVLQANRDELDIKLNITNLENNLTTKAFTPKRLKILQLLSGQAAIAISNAKLYKELQESQRRLKQFLDAMPIGVTIHESNGKAYYSNVRLNSY